MYQKLKEHKNKERNWTYIFTVTVLPHNPEFYRPNWTCVEAWLGSVLTYPAPCNLCQSSTTATVLHSIALLWTLCSSMTWMVSAWYLLIWTRRTLPHLPNSSTTTVFSLAHVYNCSCTLQVTPLSTFTNMYIV